MWHWPGNQVGKEARMDEGDMEKDGGKGTLWDEINIMGHEQGQVEATHFWPYLPLGGMELKLSHCNLHMFTKIGCAIRIWEWLPGNQLKFSCKGFIKFNKIWGRPSSYDTIEYFAGVCPLPFTPPVRAINRVTLPEIISSCAITSFWQNPKTRMLIRH